MRSNRLVLLLAAVVLALVVRVDLGAQSLATYTTTAAAVTEGATVISVTSATGFTAGNYVLLDWEVVQIRSVSGTNVTVTRGVMGTVQAPHASGNTIVTGSANYFQTADPDFKAACTRGVGEATYLPWINVRTGNVFNCRSGGTWNVTNIMPLTYNSLQTTTG